MVRWLPCAILVACTPDAARVEPSAAPAPVVAPPDAAIAITPPKPPAPPRAGSPTGSLTTLSGPDDADFVVTTDTSGGLRLWPSVDGANEPVIIPAHDATMAEAIHDGSDGIAIAVVNSVGELEIIRTTTAGAVIERIAVTLPRPVISIAATAHAFIAMRDDQRFDAFDVHGAARGEVTPDPGVRVNRMLQSRDRVIAVLEGKRHRARAFDLEHELAWGVVTPPFALDDTQMMVLSADGTQLAGVHAHQITVVELATGKAIATPQLGPSATGVDPSVVAFIGNTVWFDQDQLMYEWTIGKVPADPVPNEMPFAHATAHAMVWMQNEELLVFAKRKMRHLGYHMAQVTDLVADGDGWVGTDGAQVCHFDARLSVDRMYPEPREQAFSGNTVTLIDARHAALSGYGKAQSIYELGPKGQQPKLLETTGYRLQFERSTGIALIDSDRELQFAKWDPEAGTFGDVIDVIDRPDSMQDVRLYNPAASGMFAAYVAMTPDYKAVELTTVTKLDPKLKIRAQTIKPADFLEREQFSLFVYMPKKPAYAVSADGTLVAELLDGRITLRDREGNERWARTARGATGLAWNANDQLVAFGTGAAYVDLETGDFAGARCGWRFALWEKASNLTGGAGMCESDE